MKKQLQTGKWQFGYKEKLGTEMAVFALKNIINLYKQKGSSVLVSFLDASKAFDCVLHAKLCHKLLDRNVPVSIVSILYFWCKSQKFQVIWNGCVSRTFSVHKGVRQGGVLSPYLFNIYMDDLGLKLQCSGVGCILQYRFCNIIMYADDIILLAPTVSALQNMLGICSDYARGHNIKFNSSKSVCMRFGRDNTKVADRKSVV